MIGYGKKPSFTTLVETERGERVIVLAKAFCTIWYISYSFVQFVPFCIILPLDCSATGEHYSSIKLPNKATDLQLQGSINSHYFQ